MSYYVLDRNADTGDLLLPDNRLTAKSQQHGLSPAHVRMTFDEATRDRDSPLTFEFVGRDSNQDTDLWYWSWIPVFSNRGAEVLIKAGITPHDLFPCNASGETVYVYLPRTVYDPIDVPKSIFKTTLATVPPLPFGAVFIVLKEGAEQDLPPLFLVQPAGYLQVFAECFATETAKRHWETARLRGASFRKVAN